MTVPARMLTWTMLLAVALPLLPVRAQQALPNPRIGYVYPAGGQRGTVVEILAGGQFLRGVTEVHVSGPGITATVLEHYRVLNVIDREQRLELRRRLSDLRRQQLAEMGRKAADEDGSDRPWRRRGDRQMPATEAPETEPVELPRHPLLRNLDAKSLAELDHVQDTFFDVTAARRRQPNAQLGEMVLIEVSIAADAPPGDRELRLLTPLGLTNPLCFQVGVYPETQELEPNEPGELRPDDAALELPIVINGQVLPGDVDRFRFRAAAGQQVVVYTRARHLMPYLADAVPGWFQATVALFDSSGRELAFADDFRFDPDPVLRFDIPADGSYELEIRDAIYRGREDFVYRITVGEVPFITRMFPLGATTGSRVSADLSGWNLPNDRLRLDTRTGADRIRWTRLGDACINALPYAVNDLPEQPESEPNDTIDQARTIPTPTIVNGRISEPGDTDIFAVRADAGSTLAVEVLARRLHSPLDALVRLTDARGGVLAWNDDFVVKDGHLHIDNAGGLLTHHADAYLTATVPEAGLYFVQLTDARGHGTPAHAYRLRLGPPQPDMTVFITPSSIGLRAGGVAPLTVHVIRREGLTGPIDLTLDDAPPGFALSGARIPAGQDRICVTLTAPDAPLDAPVDLRLTARTRVANVTLTRPVYPADDVMQAFLYRHIVRARHLTATVSPGRFRVPRVTIDPKPPLRLTPGSTSTVRLSMGRVPPNRSFVFALRDPPPGIAIGEMSGEPGHISFTITADHDALEPDIRGNLIVEMSADVTWRKRGSEGEQGSPRTRRVALGVLPAIPFETVRP